MSGPEPYDPRYLAGILLFNRGDFFEAHEVWEDVWVETAGPDKQFFQGLIQAAVGLCHFCNGNVRGAIKLYHSSRDYMRKYPSPHFGVDLVQFWNAMQICFAELLAVDHPDRQIVPKEELIPEITLAPAPDHWPDPKAFLPSEEHSDEKGTA